MSLDLAPPIASSPFGNAAAYEAMMGRWSARLAPHFLNFCGEVVTGRLLDVGCGTGALLQALRDASPDLLLDGIDPDAGFVAHAQQRFAGLPVTVSRGDATALAYADASFDQTLSLLVLMVLDDPAAAARQMCRVTRAGGQVAACTWAHEGLAMSQVLWEEAVRLYPAADTAIRRFRHCNRPGQLTALWQSAGLRNVVETTIDIDTAFTGFDDFWLPMQNGVGPGGAWLLGLDAASRDELRNALRARLLDCGSDRPFSLRACALAVRGTVPG